MGMMAGLGKAKNGIAAAAAAAKRKAAAAREKSEKKKQKSVFNIADHLPSRGHIAGNSIYEPNNYADSSDSEDWD
jgi:hypothetical protein